MRRHHNNAEQLTDGSWRFEVGRGLWFYVDAEDAERVAQHSWHLKCRPSTDELYVQTSWRERVDGKSVKRTVALHRFVLNSPPGQITDHKDGDGLNNRRSNLRLCSALENSRNICNSANRKRGGYKGVFRCTHGARWEARICAGPKGSNGKSKPIYLGIFKTPEAAAFAYDRAAREHFGAFASLNFPDGPVDALPLTHAQNDVLANAAGATP